MKIVVTGATSMIGSAIVKYALSVGAEVLAIVRKNSGNFDNLKNCSGVKILECDISEYASLKTNEKADIFFHIAWGKTSQNSRDDVDAQISNIQHTIDAVILAKKMGCKKFVGAGSQAEFGIKNVDLKSDLPCNPLTGYGICKYAAGKLAKIKAESLQMEFNWVRILSVYGIGESKTNLISYVIESCLSGTSPELSPCEQMWDYLYCDDAARAMYLVGEKGENGKTYVLGSGEKKKLKQFVEIIKQKTKSDIEIKFGVKSYYKNQTDYLVADITELTSDTGFKPEISFEKGIEKTIEYHKNTEKTCINN